MPRRLSRERRDPGLQAVGKALDPGVRRGDGPARMSTYERKLTWVLGKPIGETEGKAACD